MAKLDPAVLAHLEWLGFVQPTGLVVSASALSKAGAILERQDAEGQRLLEGCVEERIFGAGKDPAPWLPDFRAFAGTVLGWSFSPKGYAGTDEMQIPPELEVPLPDYGETLRPDFAIRELEPLGERPPWQLLVQVLEPGQDLDRPVRGPGGFDASPHGRMERLLRQTRVSAGLLVNGRALRLLSAPHGESSGWLDFRVADMRQTAGRPIVAALRLLLGEARLLALPRAQRLAALLESSRRYQNDVSEQLAQQVLHALYELLRGFQAAHDASGGLLLRQALAERPDEVYRALLTVVLRLVFLLYAEELGMLPQDETFLRSYSLSGLHKRLREDAGVYPDTLNQRFGAWAQLLALFRLLHDGTGGSVRDGVAMHLPRRHGVLFDPDRFPFLEGRASGSARQNHLRIEPPRVPDGTVYRALEKLLILDGQRISYRALDVEQIGSVYETMMGFRLETASGPSVAIRAAKKNGAPVTIDLDALLGAPPGGRVKLLEKNTDRKLGEVAKRAIQAAQSIDDLQAALDKVVDHDATPDRVPPGAMVLQPSEERRRSGSHYTPRSLTEPVVKTTLEPILRRLREEAGGPPRPEQILELKICDPAMGSGAFLVEACRHLGDALREAWAAHGARPTIPPDEDEVIFARRLVAQRCLYGVDRNPVAVDLAKVSLWLATLARDHAFTFVDHALRHGDSLVGLSRRQLEAFHWDETQPILKGLGVREPLERVSALRASIREAGEEVGDWELRDRWDQVQHELGAVRRLGDLAVLAFFEGENAKERLARRRTYLEAVQGGEFTLLAPLLAERREADPPLVPFHWEIEFPEVFERANPGFDTFVGNPPFLGGTRISTVLGMAYFDWLKELAPGAGHLCDLVAYFFRRTFSLLARAGTFGLIATNTIAQGDTREGGLAAIKRTGGQIFSATKRLIWPGRASVRVSVVHVLKGAFEGLRRLNGRETAMITAFLFDKGGDSSPVPLGSMRGLSSKGSQIYGQGFLFADDDPDASPLVLMKEILAANPATSSRVLPYIGGSELNSSPTLSPHRYVIYLSDVDHEADLKAWPELERLVRSKVKPYRDQLGSNPNNIPLKRRWWAYQAHRPGLYSEIAGMSRVLACSETAKYVTFAFLPRGFVYSQKLKLFLFQTCRAFALLQGSAHVCWAEFLGSTMKDDPVYTLADCFETFPFPANWETNPKLEAAGQAYYEFRAVLMVRNDEGLTKTYNRFHDPHEHDPDIVKLRELHAAMDRAVLDAYGWHDVPTDCEFLLDYEIDEEEWGSKKKPYRFRWPDDVRDDVLARLLELNAERAREEARSGAAARKKPAAKKGSSATPSAQGNLFA